KLETIPFLRGRIFVPARTLRSPRLLRGLLEHAEQGRLAAGTIAARRPRSLERAVERREGAGATDTHLAQDGAEGATLHQRLEHPLVQALGIDARGEVEEVRERASLAPHFEHALERRAADASHRTESEADLRAVTVA